MISIDPIPAPRSIETARVRHFPEAMARFGSGATTPTREDLGGYDCARAPRWEHQREKCAYCDRDVAEGGHPTEHFRPILGGYWWLAWSWENLLFACVSCNGPKSHHFPLQPGSVALGVGEAPPGRERPYLVNPYDEDPVGLLGYKQDNDKRWLPCGLDPEGRGEKIIALCGLEQHVDAYTRWVNVTLAADLQTLQAAVDQRSAPDARAAWENIQVRHNTEHQKFRHLTWWVLNTRFPKQVRDALGLVLERPRTRALLLSADRQEERTLLMALTPTTRDLVYALGGRASDAEWDAALLAVLQEGPRTELELERICDRRWSTIRGHLHRLQAQGVHSLPGTPVTWAV